MTHYGSLCSEFYSLDKPEARPDALEFYQEQARACSGRVFEPMCGTGRYLVPLLASGFDVVGLDTSEEMLAVCQRRASELGCNAKLICGKLEEFTATEAFGLVLVPSGSFSLLTTDLVVRESLKRIYASLRPGGTFVVEVERAGLIEPSLSGSWEGRWLVRADGSTIIHSWLQQYSGVEAIARSIHRYELISNGKLEATEFQDFAVRHYEPEQFAQLLNEAGFSRIECRRPYERVAPDETDEGLLYECIRP